MDTTTILTTKLNVPPPRPDWVSSRAIGLTETSPVTHATRARGECVKTTGIGPPVPNTEAKVLDVGTGLELGPNQEGEICVRGPQVMKGYLNRPEATAAMIDTEGWLHTGDVGYADEDGCFFIVDRLKELIKYKGAQIAPAELEAVLLGHPSVADAAVVPLADEEAGQVKSGKWKVSGKRNRAVRRIVLVPRELATPHVARTFHFPLFTS